MMYYSQLEHCCYILITVTTIMTSMTTTLSTTTTTTALSTTKTITTLMTMAFVTTKPLSRTTFITTSMTTAFATTKAFQQQQPQQRQQVLQSNLLPSCVNGYLKNMMSRKNAALFFAA